ncbi:MAG: YfcE family phosphodiesterase [Promethearchaeota archaeon]|nr:MAG: YfcE family phosphodiesterase [Candidatus Lokiarchaeota archaeon]
MVTIGIISDTHITEENFSPLGVNLLNQLKNAFKNVDEVIHAGDICSKRFLIKLNEIKPVRCVLGHEDLMQLESFIKFARGSYTIGVIHKLPEDLERFCNDNKLQILIFGHTHQPLIKGSNFNTLLINPGSPTFPKAPPHKTGFEIPTPKPSVGLLKIDDDDILSTYIVNLKK